MTERYRDIAHLGAVELCTPRLKDSVWFFHDILGMEISHEDRSSVWLRGYGDFAAATLKLTAAPDAGVGTSDLALPAAELAGNEDLQRRYLGVAAGHH